MRADSDPKVRILELIASIESDLGDAMTCSREGALYAARALVERAVTDIELLCATVGSSVMVSPLSPTGNVTDKGLSSILSAIRKSTFGLPEYCGYRTFDPKHFEDSCNLARNRIYFLSVRLSAADFVSLPSGPPRS